MAPSISAERWTSELFTILDETFEQVHGIYLDKHTSLFETLADVTAAEASRPISARCASLAAQVTHVEYYLDVLSRYIQHQPPQDVDWAAAWRRTTVTPAEWEALREQLRATHQRVLALLKSIENWDGEDELGGALAIVVHTAYHLGEIRQALGVIR